MSVGNDIVDLSSPYVCGKSRDRKFLRRVLVPEEQEIVLNSSVPDDLLQVYWAAKETAYKATARTNPGVSSAPRRYRVLLEPPLDARGIRGHVRTPASDVFITVSRQKEFIHCLGVTPCQLEKTIAFGIEAIDGRAPIDFHGSSDNASCLARTFAKEKIALVFSIREESIAIIKTKNPNGASFPEVYVDMKKTDIGLSLSHDGRFIAFAIGGVKSAFSFY